MTSTELRSRVHALIDSVRSDELLTHIHDLLSGTGGTKDTGIWATMTDAQRERVMKAYAASFDPANLSTTDEVMKRRKACRWHGCSTV